MSPSAERSMLITLRVHAERLSPDGADERTVVAANRYHVAGYPVTPERGAIGHPDTILEVVWAWIESFSASARVDEA